MKKTMSDQSRLLRKEEKNYKVMKKIAACGLCTILCANLIAGCGVLQEPVKGEAEKTGASTEADAVTETVRSLLPSSETSEGKDETVYVIANADGSVRETIVSAWLHNPDGAAVLTDYADLTDITNVRGYETWTQEADGTITWNADGSDIYYQGKSTGQLPVTTEISYELDDEPLQPEMLAGKSGHLVMTFRYTNNISSVKNINGKQVTLYEPFLVISGAGFDNEKAANITVSNGKLLNTGSRTIAAGYALPGLPESLRVDTQEGDFDFKELNFPEEVVIEADVTDFSMAATVTVIDSSLLKELDLNGFEIMDQLTDACDELTDASGELKSGTGELEDGVVSLRDGTDELTDGMNSLEEGAKELYAGAVSLDEGAAQLADGAGAVTDGALALKNGTEDLAAGADQLRAGTESLEEGSAALAAGTKEYAAGIGQLHQGAADLAAGAGALKEGVLGLPDSTAALYAGLVQVKNAVKGDRGQSLYEGIESLKGGAAAVSGGLKSGDAANPGIYEAAEGITSGAASVAEGADNIAYAADQLLNELSGIQDTLNDKADSLALLISLGVIDSSTVAEYTEKLKTMITVLTQIRDGAQGISAGAKSGSDKQPGIYEAAAGIAAGSSALADGADQLAGGAGSLMEGIDLLLNEENMGALIEGMAALDEGSGALLEGAEQLSDGASGLTAGTQSAKAGAQQLAAGAESVNAGAVQINSGAAGLDAGAEAVKEGMTELYDGSVRLSDGASDLEEGTNQLKDGIFELHDGTVSLKDGGSDLKDGVLELLDGVIELKEGMIRFDEEGIQKLANTISEDAGEFVERLEALKDMSSAYTTWSGDPDQPAGSVRFIIRTEGIG